MQWNQQPRSNYSPVSPAYSSGSFYQPPPPIYEPSQNPFAMNQPVVFTTASQPAIVYAGNMAPSTPVYLPQGQPMYTCYPITINTGLMSPPNTVRAIQQLPESNNITGPVVQTEARKVIIKGLPRDTSEAVVVNLIAQSSSKSSSKSSRPCSSYIQHVELARHSDGRLKGHAFIVFQTHRIAQKVVDAMDGYKLQGRQLRAVLAKEGVEPTETFHQQQNGYTTPDPSGRLSESPSMMYGQAEERQDAALTEQWNDSSERSSKSTKGKSRDSANDDRSRKTRPKSRDPPRTSPAVADGSGRKRR